MGFIRDEIEHRHSKKQLEGLKNRLEELSSLPGSKRGLLVEGEMEGLRSMIGDIEREIAEYENLKSGRASSLDAESLDSLGELIVKARLARGLTQAELGGLLGMTQQQVQRYERDGWQKASLWRLAEAADALELDLSVRARIPASSAARSVDGIS
jgi:HTH-type transcriptional regulator/antitoxin HigA